MTTIDPSSPSPDAEGDAREQRGQRVREVWTMWAREQPKPKPSWLAPWAELTEPEREVDRRIGSALWGDGFAAGMGAMTEAQATLIESAIRQPYEELVKERDWLIKQRDSMLARGFMLPCFLDDNHGERLIAVVDRCSAGATYQCFYCKLWWCETHARGHFEDTRIEESLGVRSNG